MFFEIKPTPDSSFPHQYQLTDQLYLNCDQGWSKLNTENSCVYYKGYNDTSYSDIEFASAISQSPEPKYTGNFFAVIVNNDQTIHTTGDLYRGTPLWVGNDEWVITNLLSTSDATPIWTDQFLSIDKNLEITKSSFKLLDTVNHNSILTDDQIVDQIDNIINESFETFLTKNVNPLKVFLSGGMDSTTCFSYLKKFTNAYKIFSGDLFEFTPFILSKKLLLRQYWAYTLLNHTRTPSTIVSGMSGDECFLRGPSDAYTVMAGLGYDLITELKNAPSSYHYTYFTTPESQEKYQQKLTNPMFHIATRTWKSTVNFVLNSIANDHQHWHLENNLTFTPLKDLRITNLILCGSKEFIKGQITNADVNRLLIQRNDPDLLQYIDNQKNVDQGSTWKLYQRYWDHVI